MWKVQLTAKSPLEVIGYTRFTPIMTSEGKIHICFLFKHCLSGEVYKWSLFCFWLCWKCKWNEDSGVLQGQFTPERGAWYTRSVCFFLHHGCWGLQRCQCYRHSKCRSQTQCISLHWIAWYTNTMWSSCCAFFTKVLHSPQGWVCWNWWWVMDRLFIGWTMFTGWVNLFLFFMFLFVVVLRYMDTH